jgi:CBS-domain-containing membrane protein
MRNVICGTILFIFMYFVVRPLVQSSIMASLSVIAISLAIAAVVDWSTARRP